MDVLPKALPEQFFLDASDMCLELLSRIINAGTCGYINTYLNSPNANPAVTSRINEKLGPSIKKINLANYLRETGALEYVQKVYDRIDYISLSFEPAEIQADLNTLGIIFENYDLIEAQLKPRSKEDFQMFCQLAPPDYQHQIQVNAPYFQDARSTSMSTGLNIVIMRRAILELLYQGLKCRLEMIQKFPGVTVAVTNQLKRFYEV